MFSAKYRFKMDMFKVLIKIKIIVLSFFLIATSVPCSLLVVINLLK